MFKNLIYLSCLVLLSGLVLTSTADAELVGWWKFDDGAGAVAADSSGNGYDGTIYGDAQWIDGYAGGALGFDGVDDYVDLPIGSLIASMDNATFTLWANFTNSGGSWQRLWDFGTGETINMFLTPRIGTADEMRFAITISGYTDEDQTTAPDTLPSGWHHVALRIDIDNTTHSLYLDGEVVAENTEARYSPSTLGETTQNWIGRSQYSADGYYSGSVDDFRIYDHAMSDAELRTITVENYRQAWEPRPADGAEDVELGAKLVWNPGIINAETYELFNVHNVYMGTDFNDVNAATEPTVVLTDVNEYAPALDYDTTYYWRVDEVSSLDPNDIEEGKVWSFTTLNFLVVEDFEDYNDYEPDTIYLTWVDGFGDSTNGSTAGYPNPIFTIGQHFVETTIVHSGLQSMPLFYDNTVAGLSEATKTLTEMRDWTVDDVVTLTLFYYGEAGNTPETMYVALDGDAVVANDDPRAVLTNEWTRWDILLQDFADQSVNLSNVNSMSIGFGNKALPLAGGSGHVFFDDIRLYRSLPADVEPEAESVDPGTANLKAYYAFENNVQDTSGGGQHGTISGNPTYVVGPTGYGNALALDGTGDYVTLPIGSLIASASDITVACWVNFTNQGGSWQRLWDFGSGEDINMFVTPRIGTDGDMRFAITTGGSASESLVTAPSTLPTGWHHVTAVIDSASMTMMLYQDGRVVAEGSTTSLPSDMGTTTQNHIGLSQYAADALLQASVDEFRIYDRALSSLEVLFLAGK